MSPVWRGDDAGAGSARRASRFQILGMQRVSNLQSDAKGVVIRATHGVFLCRSWFFCCHLGKLCSDLGHIRGRCSCYGSHLQFSLKIPRRSDD
jgi:hypothetical protein